MLLSCHCPASAGLFLVGSLKAPAKISHSIVFSFHLLLRARCPISLRPSRTPRDASPGCSRTPDCGRVDASMGGALHAPISHLYRWHPRTVFRRTSDQVCARSRSTPKGAATWSRPGCRTLGGSPLYRAIIPRRSANSGLESHQLTRTALVSAAWPSWLLLSMPTVLFCVGITAWIVRARTRRRYCHKSPSDLHYIAAGAALLVGAGIGILIASQIVMALAISLI